MEELEEKTTVEEKESFWEKNKVFILRLAAWIVFSLILPVCFILFRFDIFHKEPRFALGFWGVVVIGIILAFVISTLRYVCKLMPFSMASQCISGFSRVILPLGLILVVLVVLRNNLDVFIQTLSVVLVSEAIAIPINPLPKWIHTHLTEEQQKRVSNIMDLALDKFFARKGKDE